MRKEEEELFFFFNIRKRKNVREREREMHFKESSGLIIQQCARQLAILFLSIKITILHTKKNP